MTTKSKAIVTLLVACLLAVSGFGQIPNSTLPLPGAWSVPPSSVQPGTFANGVYTFPSNLNVGNAILNPDPVTNGYNLLIGLNGGLNSGTSNTALGRAALYANTSGFGHTAIGNNALTQNTTSHYDSCVGVSCLYSNTTGSSNSCIGLNCLYYNTTGQGNVAMGVKAGETETDANANVSGANNTWIGTWSGPASPGQRQTSAAFGYKAYVDCDNCGVWGGTGVNSLKFGQGLTTPIAQHHQALPTTLLSFDSGDEGLRLESSTPATSNTTHASSPWVQLLGSIWNGTANSQRGFRWQVVGKQGTNYGYTYKMVSSDATDIWCVGGLSGNHMMGTCLDNGVDVLQVSGSIKAYQSLKGVAIQDISTAAKPTCAVGIRGTFYVEKGAGGVLDHAFICVKKADDSYAWGEIGLTIP